MSQIDKKTAQKIESAGDENLPAAQDSDGFLALASNKVALDLEDAPFLNDDTDEIEEQSDNKESKSEKTENDTDEVKTPSKKKKLIIAVGVVLFLIIGAVAVFFTGIFRDEPILHNVIVVPSQEVKTPPKMLQLQFEPFVVQCVDSNGTVRFLKASFILSTANKDVFHEISNNQKVLRDVIYYYLEIQHVETLLDTTNQQQIKLGLLETINKYVVNGEIDDLYIDSFLIY